MVSEDKDVMVKIIPGLTVRKELRPPQKSNLKQCGAINSDKLMYLSAKFSDYYKKKINKLSKKNV